MAVNEVHKSDIGTVIELTIQDDGTAVDISSATTKNIIFKKPVSGDIVTQAGAFTNSGVDGKLQYTTVSGDLDEVGHWHIQAHVVLTTGTWKSDILNMQVYDNLS